jgi:hypothetical protein
MLSEIKAPLQRCHAMVDYPIRERDKLTRMIARLLLRDLATNPIKRSGLPTWVKCAATDGNKIQINIDHVVTVRP